LPPFLNLSMAFVTCDFFARDTVTVAQDLIGITLVSGKCAGRIIETEAYTTDAASHAAKRTNRSALMHDTYGHIYVYLTYGMYYCLNFTCERDGIGAVLIRALEPVRGIDKMQQRRGTDDFKKLASGPGRLSQAFAIDLSFNGKPIGRELKLQERQTIPQIFASPRIGISKATELEWRFFEKGNPFITPSKFNQSAQL
jgi:DNA-3-methyladenine glycosylase